MTIHYGQSAQLAITRCVSISLVIALLYPFCANAQSTNVQAGNVDPESVMSSQSQVLVSMKETNESYADAVVIPILQRLATAAIFLEGASSTFEDTPTTQTLEAFRDQLSQTLMLRTMASIVDFGPIHSGGHAAAMDTRADTGGLNQLVDNEQVDINLLREAVKNPWFQGFDAMDYLLNAGTDGDSTVENFTDNKRLLLRLQATQLRQTTQHLVESWTKGSPEYPPYRSELATASLADNNTYLSHQAAAEELVRGIVNSLDVLTNETLQALVDTKTPLDVVEMRHWLEHTRAVISGVASGYSGFPVSLTTRLGKFTDHDGAGLSRWVKVHDMELHESIASRLQITADKTDRLLGELGRLHPTSQSSMLVDIHQSSSQLLSKLRSSVLPLTQPMLTAN